MDEKKNGDFGTWGILELMGHVRIAGYITEEEHFGAKLGRIDMPAGDGMVTQYFGGSSLYRLTPCSEEAARAVAAHNEPEPVHLFELPDRVTIDSDPEDLECYLQDPPTEEDIPF